MLVPVLAGLNRAGFVTEVISAAFLELARGCGRRISVSVG